MGGRKLSVPWVGKEPIKDEDEKTELLQALCFLEGCQSWHMRSRQKCTTLLIPSPSPSQWLLLTMCG